MRKASLSSQEVKVRGASLAEFPKEDKTLQLLETLSQHVVCKQSSSLCLQPSPALLLLLPSPPS